MRMQPKLRVLSGCLILAFGIGGGVLGVLAQESGGTGTSEVETLKKQMAQMEEQLRQLRRQVEQMEGKKGEQKEGPSAVAPPPEKPPAVADEQRMKRLEEKVDAALAGTKKVFPSMENPAIGLIVDTSAGYKSHAQTFNYGQPGTRDAGAGFNNDRPAGGDFDLRAGELMISSQVDPFTRAYGVLAGSADPTNNNQATISVEEANIITTRLPYNLTLRGGRYFADFGTLSRQHDHDLPFVDRPPSLDAFVGGEGQTDGVELSWLAPTSTFLRFSAGVGDKFGEDFGSPPNNVTNLTGRPLKGMTYFGKVQSYFDINDNNNFEYGFSIADSPKFTDVCNCGEFERQLLDVDFKYRWYPLATGLYQSFTVAGELLYDHGNEDPVNGGPRLNALGQPARQGAWGGYTYAEARLNRQWRAGFRFDYYQLPSEPELVTNPFTGLPASTLNASGNRTANRTYSPYLTFFASEFQRVRLQYNHYTDGNANNADEFFLQWTVVLGSHSHGFTDRE